MQTFLQVIPLGILITYYASRWYYDDRKSKGLHNFSYT